MATMTSLSVTTASNDTDLYLVSQGGVDYTQSRETFSESLANSRWSSTVDYDVGSETIGSDDEKYLALVASGPLNAGAIDPTTDGGSVWKKLYRESFIEVVNTLYPVGSVTLRMDAINPSTIYTNQTWTLLYTADADIKLGDGSVQSGTATGDNSPSVPLKNHTHSFSGTTNNNTVATSVSVPQGTQTGDTGTATTFADDPQTAVDLTHNHAFSGTSDTSGDGASPTLDVRGKGVAINVWQRTA
jgi:hypothetical protein